MCTYTKNFILSDSFSVKVLNIMSLGGNFHYYYYRGDGVLEK